jgi:hypothetical protein
MEGICRFADDKEYGPCEGPVMQLNDNPGTTFDCERHARLITAWIEVTRGQKVGRPLHKFWDSLDADAMQELEQKMKTVSLDSYIPYVPRLTQRRADLLKAAEEAAQNCEAIKSGLLA